MKKAYVLIALVCFCACLPACSKTEISESKARRIAEAAINDSEKATITNYSDPAIERVVIGPEHRGIDALKGKTIWKITYNTTLDGWLGPITLYIDVFSGEILWRDLRL